MQMNRKIALVMAGALVLSGTGVWALSQKSEDQKIWNSYIDTKKGFEKDVHDLVADKWPKEKNLAQAHLRLELARLGLKDSQFDYIVKRDPARIDRNKGLDDFAQFEWSDKDDSVLKGMDKSYAKQSQEVRSLQNTYDGLNGRSDFEKHLNDVKGTVEYRSMAERYHDMVAKLETTWKNIKSDLKN